MFKDFDTRVYDDYIQRKFPIIYEFEFNGLLFLFGGTVRDLMMGKKESKDLDFVLLTQKEDNIKEFIDKYNIEILAKITYGYKLKYKDTIIDIISVNDLYYCSPYNIIYLFYDIKRKILIPIGIRQAIEKNKIIEYQYYGYHRNKEKEKKAKEFLTFLNKKKHHKIVYKYSKTKIILEKIIKKYFTKKY